MDIDALKAFVTIVNEKSFSNAAKVLHLTQPAISKRIQNLEGQLDVKLFERLQREIILTEAGETLLPRALSILHEYDNAKQAIKDLDDSVNGSLRIVASHHIGLHRIPLILKSFASRYPEVEMHLNFLDSESAYQLLKENAADIAFITVSADIPDDFNLHLLWDDPMSFISGREHALAQIKGINMDDLAQYNAILPSKSTLTYKVVDALFEEKKLKLNASIPTNYLETMKMMAAVGMGWTVLPNTMVDEELTVLDLGHTPVSRRLGAVSYRKKHLGNAAKAFIQEAEKLWGNLKSE